MLSDGLDFSPSALPEVSIIISAPDCLSLMARAIHFASLIAVAQNSLTRKIRYDNYWLEIDEN